MSFATIMVHVDVERDFEQRIQPRLDWQPFRGDTVGVAGLALRPAFRRRHGRLCRTHRN